MMMTPPHDSNHETEQLLPLHSAAPVIDDDPYANDPVHQPDWMHKPVNRSKRARARRWGIKIPHITTGYGSEEDDAYYEYVDLNKQIKIK